MHDDEPSSNGLSPWQLLLVIGVPVFLGLVLLVAILFSAGSTPEPHAKVRPGHIFDTVSRPTQRDDGMDASSLSLLCMTVTIVLAIITIRVLMMAWVAKDCRARGMDGGAVWVLMILIFGIIATVVYLASRPHGLLIACGHCSNKRIAAAFACPHCGHRT